LNVLTLVESILEDPEIILQKQLDKLKSEKIAQMKADGIDYETRMEELEKLEYPKPLRDFIYSTFNEFAQKHPWVENENIRPKSIAREMYELFRTFEDYVQDYSLQRVEGVLLRHLSNVHKVLSQTVPDSAKTEEVREMERYFKLMIRQIDSSLLEEWERMKLLSAQPVKEVVKAIDSTGELPQLTPQVEEIDITADFKSFVSEVRNQIFIFLRHWINGQYDKALLSIYGVSENKDELLQQDWVKTKIGELKQVQEEYLKEHHRLSFEPEARNLKYTHIEKDESNAVLQIQQVLVDVYGFNDWIADFTVDLKTSKQKGRPDITLKSVRPAAEL